MVAESPRRSLGVAAGALALLGGACGGGAGGSTGGGAPAPAEEARGDPSAPAAGGSARGRGPAAAPVALSGEEPYDSQELGALHGTILFEGQAPERFQLGAAQMKECLHHPGVDQRSNVAIVTDGRLANAFVTLRSGYDPSRVPPPASPAVTLDQRGCMYVPRVLGLQLGQKLLVANSDPTTHNVHARPRKNDELNRSMGASQAPLEFLFEHREQAIPFQCDIHPWMGAAVFVEEHPWFAVSDEAGAFHIPALPPGEYVVEALHELLGKAQGSVRVEAGKSIGFTLTIRK
jgi:plastocyanin